MVRIRRQLEKSGTERMEITTDSIKQRLQRSRVIMEDSLSVATGQLQVTSREMMILGQNS